MNESLSYVLLRLAGFVDAVPLYVDDNTPPPLMVEGENGGRLYDFQQIAGISCCTEHPAMRVHTRLLPWAEGVQESA